MRLDTYRKVSLILQKLYQYHSRIIFKTNFKIVPKYQTLISSKKACEFKYVHAVNKLVKQNTCQLDDHEGRVHVAGNYDNHECGMKISEAIPSDAGEWRVEVSIMYIFCHFFLISYFQRYMSNANRDPQYFRSRNILTRIQ